LQRIFINLHEATKTIYFFTLFSILSKNAEIIIKLTLPIINWMTPIISPSSKQFFARTYPNPNLQSKFKYIFYEINICILFLLFIFISIVRSCFPQRSCRSFFQLPTLGESRICCCLHLRKPDMRWRKALGHFRFPRLRDGRIFDRWMDYLEKPVGTRDKNRW